MSEIISRLSAALAERYRFDKQIGQGGMATVYLAEDIKHERKVAIKVLRPELAAVIGAERFLKEIKVTANLQHPHILPLHDSGEADSFLYYVMPFVEGETLRDKLDREKQFGVEDAVDITKAIASALDYAHRQDVIHRDIKPENILLHDGQALVSDFGIALAVSSASDTRLTETGLSIGTPHYMSPEQAMGDRELDARSDIYSLGAMLYEMLVGEPPYTGATAQAIVAKVITEKAPPVTAHRDTIPNHIDCAISKALFKIPADRFPSAQAFADALSNPAFTIPSGTPITPIAGAMPEKKGLAVRFMWPAIAAIFAATAVAGWLRKPPPATVSRFALDIPEDMRIQTWFGTNIAISPDGDRFVYTGPSSASDGQLLLRNMSQIDATPIPGTDGPPLSPFFSADGRSVAFFNFPTIRVVSLDGGPPLTVVDSAVPVGGDWGPDNRIYYSRTGSSGLVGLSAVSVTGGNAEIITTIDTASGEFNHRSPDVLPNGRGVLFTIWRGSLANSDIAVVSLESGETTILVRGVSARYANTGHLVYTRADGALLAIPFDLNKLETTGGTTPILEGIALAPGGSEFAISDNGTLLYLSGERSFRNMVWVSREGAEREVDGNLTRDFVNLSLSPDGSRVVFASNDDGGTRDLWVYDIERQIPSRLTFDGTTNHRPFWNPDGSTISYMSERDGDRALYSIPADGSGQPQLLMSSAGPIQEGWWSDDGRYLIYRRGPYGDTGRDILFAEPGVDTTSTPFLETNFDELTPNLSPDGRWMAYVSDESGPREVFVRPFPGPGGRHQISNGGGVAPRWSHTGNEIFYRSGDRQMMSVHVTTSPTFSQGRKEILFSDGDYARDIDHIAYDVTPDDQTFLMIKTLGGARRAIVVLNWFEELENRTRE